MNLLDELLNHYCDAQKLCKPSEEYCAISKRLTDSYENLIGQLNPKQFALFAEIDEVEGERLSLNTSESLRLGFKTAIRLIIDCLRE